MRHPATERDGPSLGTRGWGGSVRGTCPAGVPSLFSAHRLLFLWGGPFLFHSQFAVIVLVYISKFTKKRFKIISEQ